MMGYFECWLDSFVLFTGDPDQHCLETLYFVIFQGKWGGGGPDPLSPALDPRMVMHNAYTLHNWHILILLRISIYHKTTITTSANGQFIIYCVCSVREGG